MRLDIRYLTRFRYDGAVSESQNELRASPATDDRQWLVHYHVTTTPSSRVLSYTDYWGTRVDTFGIRLPHEQLEVLAEATVETVGPSTPPASIDPAAFREAAFRDAHLEFLQRSPHVDWGDTLAAAAHDAVAGLDDGLAMIHAVHDLGAGLEYREGETYVGVDVDDVFERGAGVCQDVAHLTLAAAREVGIPSRYVSGYLFTVDDSTGEDTDTDEVEVQTHAWVEFAMPGAGWLALDPTNAQPVGERHVTIGRGRDYDDVSPLRGVFSGAQRHELEVSVAMRRLAREPLGDAVDPARARAAAQQ
ncbi:MAG: transglutaminase family protein [Nitriliruptoraceae bacterium]|nr:transglutaminase family protein [Nitriliruptoraceae bacterium]